MMYSTVFMYGLDGRLSPLSYNRVCRVGNLLEYLASSPWVYPNAIFVVSPEGLGSVTGISVSTCGDPCIVLHWSQRFPRICAPFRPLETTKTAPARPLAAEFPHRFQLRGNNCCFLILLSFFFSHPRLDSVFCLWDLPLALVQCFQKHGGFIKSLPTSRKWGRYGLALCCTSIITCISCCVILLHSQKTSFSGSFISHTPKVFLRSL